MHGSKLQLQTSICFLHARTCTHSRYSYRTNPCRHQTKRYMHNFVLVIQPQNRFDCCPETRRAQQQGTTHEHPRFLASCCCMKACECHNTPSNPLLLLPLVSFAASMVKAPLLILPIGDSHTSNASTAHHLEQHCRSRPS